MTRPCVSVVQKELASLQAPIVFASERMMVCCRARGIRVFEILYSTNLGTTWLSALRGSRRNRSSVRRAVATCLEVFQSSFCSSCKERIAGTEKWGGISQPRNAAKLSSLALVDLLPNGRDMGQALGFCHRLFNADEGSYLALSKMFLRRYVSHHYTHLLFLVWSPGCYQHSLLSRRLYVSPQFSYHNSWHKIVKSIAKPSVFKQHANKPLDHYSVPNWQADQLYLRSSPVS